MRLDLEVFGCFCVVSGICQNNIVQNMAMGLTGDPVTPLNLHGSTEQKNSYRPSCLQTEANSSKSALSKSHNPMATIPML